MGVGTPDGVTLLTRMTTRTMATTSAASSTGGIVAYETFGDRSPVR